MGMRQYEEIVRPDAVWRAVGEEERDLAGCEHGGPALGQIE